MGPKKTPTTRQNHGNEESGGIQRTNRPGDNAGSQGAARVARKRARGESWPRVSYGKEFITLESLTRQLSECQRNRDQTAAELPELVRERNRLLAAKNPKQLRTWEKEKGRIATRGYRSNEHDRLRNAQTLLEDFIYLQNPTHRRLRHAALQADYSPPDLDTEGRRIPYLLVHAPDPRFRSILDTFDAHGIGGPLHRQGLTDWGGEPTQRKASDPETKLVRPNELRLWTPACRRRPVGFGVTENYPIEPTRLQLDEEAISEVCKHIEESAPPHQGESLQSQTHAQRRQEELLFYESTRPTTASVLERTTEGMRTVDRFKEIRTREGVFISALESSYDWHTWYDSFGSVSDSIHPNFTISAERETINGPDGDPGQEPGGSSAHGGPTEAVSGPEPSKKKRPDHKTVFSTRKKPRKGATRPQEPQVSVTIDYPYPAKEFEDTSRARRPRLITDVDQNNASVSTAGRHNTYGRHEWHDHMSLPPASPVVQQPDPPVSQQRDGNRVAHQGVEYHDPEHNDPKKD